MKKNIIIYLIVLVLTTIQISSFYAIDLVTQNQINREKSGGENNEHTDIGRTGEFQYSFPMGIIGAGYTSNSGWSVGKKSVISRSSTWNVPNYTDDDIFALDGMELVYDANSSTNEYNVYHTKKENYKKIKYINPGTNSSYWQVIDKDGTTSTYGESGNSRINRYNYSDDAQPRAWAIDETRNEKEGNIIKYYYDNVQYAFYIIKIIRGKIGADLFSATQLHYESSNNLTKNYRAGTMTMDTKRVKTVENIIGCDSVGGGGNKKNAYNIEWINSTSSNKSLISKITPYGSDYVITDGSISSESYLPETTFEYSNGSISFADEEEYGNLSSVCLDKTEATEVIHNQTTSKTTDTLIDINGDKLPDKVHFDNGTIYVWENDGNGFAQSGSGVWSQYLGEELDCLRETRNDADNNKGYTTQIFMDINGDGLPDIIKKDTSIYKELSVWLNNGHGFDTPIDFPGIRGNCFIRTMVGGVLTQDLIDMNGDGLPDFVKRSNDDYYANPFRVYKNTGSAFSTEYERWDVVTPPENGAGIRRTKSEHFGYTTYKLHDLIDINGDGLPDFVNFDDSTTPSSYTVHYNNGHGFESEKNIKIGDALDNSIETVHERKLSYWHTNPNYDSSFQIMGMIDVNFDGLIDMVSSLNGTNKFLTVRINDGQNFKDQILLKQNNSYSINYENSTIIFNDPDDPNDDETIINSQTNIFDINGDGMIDFVVSDLFDNNKLSSSLNNSQYPNDFMLTRVKNSLGGSTECTYKPMERTINSGYRINNWVVDTITRNDGFNNLEITDYEFHNGYYDISERENRGFGKVVVTDPMGNITETYYYQGRTEENKWKSGLVEKTITKDKDGNIYSYGYNNFENYALKSTDYAYGLSQSRVLAAPQVVVNAPRLVQTDTYLVGGAVNYENDNGTGPAVSSLDWKRLKKVFSYDNYGNLKEEENFGEVDASGNDFGYDKVKIVMEYFTNLDTWEFAPSSKEILGTDTDGESNDYNKSVKEYYKYSSSKSIGVFDETGINQGYLKAVYSMLDGNRVYTARYGYDAYGNVNITRDALGNDTTLVYDTKFGLFPIQVTNALDHTAYNYYDNHTNEDTDIGTISTNISLGRLTRTRDANEVFTDTYYDVFGRETKQVLPGDSLDYPTVEIEYRDYQVDDGDGIIEADEIAYVKTSVREISGEPVSGQTGTLDSYAYMDGLGRTIQTITESVNDAEAQIWVANDTWYSVVNNESIQESSSPHTVTGTGFSRSLNPTGELIVSKSYLDSDEGHVTETIAFNEIDTSYTYKHQFTSTSKDAKNNYTKTTTDGLGNVISIDNNGYTTSTFSYNSATGALLKSIENAGGTTEVEKTFTYDELGRLISATDPDTGTTSPGITSYTYDDNGNLSSQTDAKGQAINYVYDDLGRIRHEKYLGVIKVSYFYDEGGVIANAVGLLTHIEDESGSTYFYYDESGQLSSEEKHINGFGSQTTSYEYDAMGRITQIIYPDSEVIIHTYNGSGNLERLGIDNEDNKYIQDIEYNLFGNETLRLLGNGSSNNYTYYDAGGNYRMENSKVISKDPNNPLVKVESLNYKYVYDEVGNITSIIAANDLFYQNFIYDSQYRLVEQDNGTFAGGRLSYLYDPLDNITDKNGIVFSYDLPKPHAVTSTTAYRYYEYDDNGNMIKNGTNMPEVEPIKNLNAVAAGDGRIYLSWEKPDGDFFGVKILRKTTDDYSSTPDDGEVVITLFGATEAFDIGLTKGTIYYYTAYSYNRYGKYSEIGATAFATPGAGVVLPDGVNAASAGVAAIPSPTAVNFKSFYKIYNYGNKRSGLFIPCTDFSDQDSDFTLKSVVFPTYLNGSKSEIISKRQRKNASDDYSYSLYLHTDNKLYFDFNAARYITDQVLETEQFYSIFVIYDSTISGDDKIKIYVNGNLVNATVDSAVISPDDNKTVWMLNKGYNVNFAGYIDEVSIYDRIFDTDEILSYYNELNKSKTSYSYSYDYKDRLIAVSEISKTANAPDPGLVAKWNMDEGTGILVTDTSGNGNNGTIVNGVVWVEGISGSALSFDGVDDYAEIINSNINVYNNFTLECRLKAANNIGKYQVFLAKGPKNAGHYELYLHPDGTIRFYSPDFTSGDIYGFTIDKNVWYHIAVTYNNGTMKFYKDGNLIRTVTGIGGTISEETEVFRLGSLIDGGLPFEGLLDEVAIYNNALTDVEITDHFNNPAGGHKMSTYVYDYSGQRVKKVEEGITTLYFNKYYEEERIGQSTTNTKYYYANNQLIGKNTGGDMSYYHQDHLGSTSVITNSFGVESNRLAYMPYGELAYIEDFEGNLKKYYTGQEMDLTGLYYYGARYYDPTLGRFLTLDPMGDDYCYVGNNPIMYNDPSGMIGEVYGPPSPSGDDYSGSSVYEDTITFEDNGNVIYERSYEDDYWISTYEPGYSGNIGIDNNEYGNVSDYESSYDYYRDDYENVADVSGNNTTNPQIKVTVTVNEQTKTTQNGMNVKFGTSINTSIFPGINLGIDFSNGFNENSVFINGSLEDLIGFKMDKYGISQYQSMGISYGFRDNRISFSPTFRVLNLNISPVTISFPSSTDPRLFNPIAGGLLMLLNR